MPRKERETGTTGRSGRWNNCRVRLRQGNTLTALMTLVAARTLAALQAASVPRAVRRASMARAYAAFVFAPSFVWTRIMGSDFARLPGRSGNTVVHENRPQVNSTCSEVPTSQNSKCPPTPALGGPRHHTQVRGLTASNQVRLASCSHRLQKGLLGTENVSFSQPRGSELEARRLART